MTRDEYFDAHIPHRMNLLVAFRTRYSGRPSPHALDPEQYRDLFRCAKDICFLMTRFFCKELGLVFDGNTLQLDFDNDWTTRYGTTRVLPDDLRSDPRWPTLCLMYMTANRAVAHINDHGVDHPFLVESDHQRMIEVIDWLEELIRDHIYVAAGRNLAHSMNLPNNRMVS